MKVLRRLAITALVLVIVIAVVGAAAWALAAEQKGALPEGERLQRIAASPSWRDGHFVNRLRRVDAPILVATARFFFGGGSSMSVPSAPPPTRRRARVDYETPPASGLRVTWLGHSTTLVEIGGKRVLTDPM